MGSLKEGPTTTTTTQNAATLPPHITAAQQYLMAIGQGLTAPQFAHGRPQLRGDGAYPGPDHGFRPGGAGRHDRQQLAAEPGRQRHLNSVRHRPRQASAAQAAAQQLAPGEISPFMNPYIDTALNPVLERLQEAAGRGAVRHRCAGRRVPYVRRQPRGGDADAGGQELSATRSAPRPATCCMPAGRPHRGLASQNADRRQQTALTNAQLQNAINALNAQLSTQTSIANAGF